MPPISVRSIMPAAALATLLFFANRKEAFAQQPAPARPNDVVMPVTPEFKLAADTVTRHVYIRSLPRDFSSLPKDAYYAEPTKTLLPAVLLVPANTSDQMYRMLQGQQKILQPH